MRWTVETLDARVDRELAALPAGLRARYTRLAATIEDFGPRAVGMPYVRHLEGRLWEMRLKAREGIARAVYVAVKGRRIVVLHAFVKKTEKTPQRALKTARQRLKEMDRG